MKLKEKKITNKVLKSTNDIFKFKCNECGSTDPKVCKGGYNNCPYS